jgi:hypothetical protein
MFFFTGSNKHVLAKPAHFVLYPRATMTRLPPEVWDIILQQGLIGPPYDSRAGSGTS